jgi:hypothetical protein
MLDEIQAADDRTFKVLYQLIQERVLDGKPIHPNLRFVAARNTINLGSNDQDIPAALKNRMAHAHVITTPNAWLDWAVLNNIHPIVIAFIKLHPDMLFKFDNLSAEDAFPTPRSWDMFSAMITTAYTTNLPTDTALLTIGQATVGREAAVKLQLFSKSVGVLPDIDAVINDPIYYSDTIEKLPPQAQWLLAIAIAAKATQQTAANCTVILDLLPRKEIGAMGLFTLACNKAIDLFTLAAVSQTFAAYIQDNSKLITTIKQHKAN